MDNEVVGIVIVLLIAISILGGVTGQYIQINRSNKDICNRLYALKVDYDKCTHKQYDDNLKLIKVIGGK